MVCIAHLNIGVRSTLHLLFQTGKLLHTIFSVHCTLCFLQCATNWDDNEASTLLRMLVDHWVTIRGYSLTNSVVEKYKQEFKKMVQKSKGLRKNLL